MLSTIAVVVILVSAPLVFFLLFFTIAPYGRHYREGWGPSVTSQAGWAIMEAPAVLVIGLTVLWRLPDVSTLSVLFLALWEVHYLYRTCLFPALMRDRGKRFPVLLIAFAGIFNTLNGYANGAYLAGSPDILDGSFLAGIRCGLGVALFAGGFATHVWADSRLRSLRRSAGSGYSVPSGGLFDYVASPNYFGEIVQWTGWAIATWSLPGLAFAAFTAANLVPRARANRAWYRATFPDYPRNRKRVVPLLY
jgi:3-oxo-5-alpha-steroid 4-dehydrogenase 1